MKIVYLYREEWEKEYVSKQLSDFSCQFLKSLDEASKSELQEIEVLCLFVSHQCKQAELDRLPKLKLIAARSTGFDYVDIPAARARGVEVVYVPSYGENTVAEFAFALLLSLSRKIPEAHEQVTKTGSFAQGNLRGFDLKGKTIGIVGTGRIGMHVTKMAEAFQMNVLAYDPFPKTDSGIKYVSLDELLASSDIISLHAPLTEQTKHLINLENISKIKKGVYLINTARGSLVETAALVKALEDGIIAGAALDVLEEEGDMADEDKLLENPHPKLDELQNVLRNHYLIDHPAVLITPHIAYNSEEAVQRIVDTTIDNILAFSKGEVKNRVPN
jgi:D-lactate dehydrogenase